MIARIQQFSTLTLLILAIGWAVAFAVHGSLILAVTGALLILLGYAVFLGVEFVLLSVHGGDSAAARPRAAQLLRAWAGEVVRAPLVFCWRQPFRSRAEADSLGAEHAGRRGVVFVHGFVCNRALWNPWMRILRSRGVPFVAVNLEPPFGSISAYADTIDAAVARLESMTGQPPVVVAHSMGGLAVRCWLATQADAERVQRVITIASPHCGTWLARFAMTPNGTEMRVSGIWLEALNARERIADRSRYTCYYGHCDNIVFPTSSGTLPGADNRHLAATAHVQMAYHPDVIGEVLRCLASVPSTPDPNASPPPIGAAEPQP